MGQVVEIEEMGVGGTGVRGWGWRMGTSNAVVSTNEYRVLVQAASSQAPRKVVSTSI